MFSKTCATVPITQTLAFHADLGYVRYSNHLWAAGSGGAAGGYSFILSLIAQIN
jgi:hypothetical protein